MEVETPVALVTGASRGIGRAIALELGRRGYIVIVNYAGNQILAEEVVTQIANEGGQAEAVHCDVSQKEAVENLFKNIKEKYGRIDVLVNNAGITRDTLLLRMKENQWDEVLATNLKSNYLTIKEAAAMMIRKKKGVIINIASVVGITGNIGQLNYSAAKAGVIGMTKTAAKELAGRGIRVNAVAPGFIKTDMTDKIPEGLSLIHI